MRPWWHRGWRRRTSLLALGALERPEADEARAHVDGCARCAEDLARLRQALELAALDPVRTAEPPLGLPALLARVDARLEAAAAAEPRLGGRMAWLVPAGALAAGLAALLLLRPARTPPAPPATPTGAAETHVAVPEDMLGRMERTVTRAQTARYLDEAQDLLLTVAAPRPCAKRSRRVDVEQEAERSRELLARRALLMGTSGEDVASARPVLRDVEYVLREVASLPSCARERDLQAIQREVSRRNLLIKIDLMTRELKG
ncbi:MAG TPA: hypothetical protein VGN09_25590 [Vicinamibacteria bacterium]